MPIVINGGSRRAGAWWSKHLANADKKNERAEVIEFRGLASENLREAFRELEVLAIGTRCKNYFYQANINPRADEHLTPEQWERTVDVLETNLGFEGLPRFVVEHEKAGRVHRHVVWGRIDPDTRTARSDSLTAAIHERTSRELEIEFGLERGQSVLVPDRDFERPERGPEKWEIFRGAATGLDPRDVAAEVRELRAGADNGQAFVAALRDAGYTPCLGDRRDFCILDGEGDVHSLGRRVGMKAAAFREFMADVDRATLPTVEAARQEFANRLPEVSRPVLDQQREAFFTSIAERQAEHEPIAPTAAALGKAGREIEGAADTVAGAGGKVVSGVGALLGGAVRLAEAPLAAIVDFLSGSPGSEIAPPMEAAPAVAPERSTRHIARDQLHQVDPNLAATDPQIQAQAATHTSQLDQDLADAIRRAKETARRNRDRDDDGGRERD